MTETLIADVGEDVFTFLWPRFECIVVERRLMGVEYTAPTRALVNPLTARSADARYYRPLTEAPALFRLFAATEDTQQAILAFANQYGLLGIPAPFFRSGEHAPAFCYLPGHYEPNWQGEPLFEWQDAIARMRHLTRLWDLVEAHDKRGLAEFFRWEGDTCFIRCPPPIADYPTLRIQEQPGRLPRWRTRKEVGLSKAPPGIRRGDFFVPARWFIQRCVSGEMERNAHTVACLRWNHESSRANLALSPGNLWAAMLLQFAQCMEGSQPIRRCLGCGEWFKLGAEQDSRRADARVCSDSCRVRAHRAKQAALDMKAKRKSVNQIAVALKRDPSVIREWLTANKRKGN